MGLETERIISEKISELLIDSTTMLPQLDVGSESVSLFLLVGTRSELFNTNIDKFIDTVIVHVNSTSNICWSNVFQNVQRTVKKFN